MNESFHKIYLHNKTVNRMTREGASMEDIVIELAFQNQCLLDQVMRLSMIVPRKIKLENGDVMIYRCPEHLIPDTYDLP